MECTTLLTEDMLMLANLRLSMNVTIMDDRKYVEIQKQIQIHKYKNPVYGMYYFADGGHVDAGKSEVTDENDYYAS